MLWLNKKANMKTEKKTQKSKATTPLGIEPRISGSVDQRLIHWAMESLFTLGLFNFIEMTEYTIILWQSMALTDASSVCLLKRFLERERARVFSGFLFSLSSAFRV